MPRSLGESASRLAARIQGDDSLVIVEHLHFGSAIVACIESRRTGAHFTALPLLTSPRMVVLRNAFATIAQLSRDVAIDILRQLRRGVAPLANTTQQQYEEALLAGATRAYYDLCSLSNQLEFRSMHDVEVQAALLGVRPRSFNIISPQRIGIPAPLAPAERGTHVAVWAVGVPAIDVEILRYFLADLPLDLVIVTEPSHDSAELLSRASGIICIDDDPGVATMLAHYGRPICAASHGAAEFVPGIATFDLWDIDATVDAVLRMRAHSTIHHHARETNANPPHEVDSEKLVSIVVVVYDRLQLLDENLARLQQQTYRNIEIIVVSNNGPDARHICEKYENVRYIHRDLNSGEAVTPREDGMRAARGAYITALDDDDIFFPDHIERLVDALSEGAEVAFCDFIIAIVDKQPDGSEVLIGYDLENTYAFTPHELLVYNRMGYLGVMFTRELYERLGGYDVSIPFGVSELDLWLRYLKSARAVRVEPSSALYTIRRSGQGSVTATLYNDFATGFEAVYKRHPIPGYARFEHLRSLNLQTLRTTASPPREPRYVLASATPPAPVPST